MHSRHLDPGQRTIHATGFCESAQPLQRLGRTPLAGKLGRQVEDDLRPRIGKLVQLAYQRRHSIEVHLRHIDIVADPRRQTGLATALRNQCGPRLGHLFALV